MDSTPRRWVLRPLSPSLQPSDLRSISAQREDNVFFTESISIVGSQSAVYVEDHSHSSADVVIEARQVSVSQDDDAHSRSSSRSSSSADLPLSPCSSSSGASHNGFYSFVEDPFSPEAEHNEAWMVSPQRQTQLATLREKNSHKLQSYSGPRRPGNLFQDESADSQYRIDEIYGYKVVGEQEERQLRKEIIRNQAPKQSPLFEKDGGDDTSRLIEGLSISYSHVVAKPAVVVDSTVSEEQINFDAARKQFLQMEQNKLDPIIRPRKIQVKTSPQQNPTLQGKEASREEQVFKPKVEYVVDAEVKEEESGSSRQSSFFEEPDGLSLNVRVSHSSDDGRASEQMVPEDAANPFTLEHETPIEREIRIAQEREENLRRSRGLQHSVSGEMVEIKIKRLQSPFPLTQAKDKGRVSFNFQEIQRKEEATRQDGARRDIVGPRRKRASSFEILEAGSAESDATQSNKESAITRAFETLEESVGEKFDVVDYALQKQSYQDNRQSSTQLLQEYVEPYLRNAQQETENNRFPNDQELARKAEFEGYVSTEERWQSHNQNGDRMENGYTSVAERSRVESFSDDVFPLPLKHPKDSEQDGPSRWNPQAPSWRNSLEKTGLQTRGEGAAGFIERDIEDALRREQELREQREAQERQVYSPQTLVQQADKTATTQFYPRVKTDKAQFRSSPRPPIMRMSGVPLMSPQPWSPAPQTPFTPQTPFSPQTRLTPQTPFTPQTPSTPQTRVTPQTPLTSQTPLTPQTPVVVPTTPLAVRGLTHTLLHDFEERRVKLKLEESAYAGIQPVDSVNNEVVESTRVARHKNQRALQWEAGLFANQQD